MGKNALLITLACPFFSSALSFSEGLFDSSNVKVNGKGKS